MNNFKKWLQIFESKGIKLNPNIQVQIDSMIDSIFQAAKISKQTGNDIELPQTINYQDKYFQNKERKVSLNIINDPNLDFNGDFNPIMGIQINVAHIKDKELTPKWLERIIIHELIHSQDPKISDFKTYSKMGAKSYSKSGDSYYTQPLEFDAYTGQIIHAIINAAKKHKNTDKERLLRKNLEDTLKYLSNPEKSKIEKTYGAIGDPEFWKYYQIYLLHGSPDQKRKIKQRIYKAVIDAKNILDS